MRNLGVPLFGPSLLLALHPSPNWQPLGCIAHLCRRLCCGGASSWIQIWASDVRECRRSRVRYHPQKRWFVYAQLDKRVYGRRGQVHRCVGLLSHVSLVSFAEAIISASAEIIASTVRVGVVIKVTWQSVAVSIKHAATTTAARTAAAAGTASGSLDCAWRPLAKSKLVGRRRVALRLREPGRIAMVRETRAADEQSTIPDSTHTHIP